MVLCAHFCAGSGHRLPISVISRTGFGDARSSRGDIRLAADAGDVGGASEDATGSEDQPCDEPGYGCGAASARGGRDVAPAWAFRSRSLLRAEREGKLAARPAVRRDLKGTTAASGPTRRKRARCSHAPGLQQQRTTSPRWSSSVDGGR